jgi:uncharacterized protein YecA (UPF0149 family)
MDDKGNLYFDPTPELVVKKKLRMVGRPLSETEVKRAKIGRNAPCGCGSGVKFKKCCYGKPWAP